MKVFIYNILFLIDTNKIKRSNEFDNMVWKVKNVFIQFILFGFYSINVHLGARRFKGEVKTKKSFHGLPTPIFDMGCSLLSLVYIKNM